jgi:hypothetical protein
MDRAHLRALLLTIVVAMLPAARAFAQAIPATNGRFSLFANWTEREPVVGEKYTFTELIANLSLHSDTRQESRFEWALDSRVATYPDSDNRDERVSLYEAWIGVRAPDNAWKLRLGQLWLHELGGLGRIGGLFAEFSPRRTPFRFGLFAGLEPKIRDSGYVEDIEKAGAYVAVDASHGRRHVLGWVLIRNEELTERSVVVFSNFVPVGRKFFLYQALEYDVEGPAGLGSDELTYLFTNLRYAPARVVEFQGTYHRGRSVDARSITEDVLDGRPVDPARLDGLLFESARFRVTVSPWRRLRVWAGVGQDRNNRDDDWNDRLNFGLSLNDILGIGLDLTASNTQIDRVDNSYDSTYVSIGKTLGRRVYVSVDYITSLSVFYYGDRDGGFIEVRPESERYALSINANLSRIFSLLLVGEWMDHDDFEEVRALTGLVIRF